MDNLPKALLVPESREIPKYSFCTFRPDPAFLQRTEDEVGTINESFLKSFLVRRQGLRAMEY
jgi:hypothetical protein